MLLPGPGIHSKPGKPQTPLWSGKESGDIARRRPLWDKEKFCIRAWRPTVEKPRWGLLLDLTDDEPCWVNHAEETRARKRGELGGG